MSKRSTNTLGDMKATHDNTPMVFMENTQRHSPLFIQEQLTRKKKFQKDSAIKKK